MYAGCLSRLLCFMFAAPSSGVAWCMWTQESWGGGPLSRHGWTANFLPKSQMLPRCVCVCTFCEFHPKISFWYLILLSLLQSTSTVHPSPHSLFSSFPLPPYLLALFSLLCLSLLLPSSICSNTCSVCLTAILIQDWSSSRSRQLRPWKWWAITHLQYECILCCECKLSKQSFTRVLLQSLTCLVLYWFQRLWAVLPCMVQLHSDSNPSLSLLAELKCM